VLVEDFFGEGTDQGIAAQAAVVALLGLSDEVIDMEGAGGGEEELIDDINIRHTFFIRRSGRRRGALSAQGTQDFELSLSGFFEDFEEFLPRQVGIGHKSKDIFDKIADIRYMSIMK
jgi:hypothetical protein